MSILRAVWGPPGERRDQFGASSIIPGVESAAAGMSQDSATRLITVMRCNQLLADTVATLPVSVIERRGGAAVPLPLPDFLTYPIPEDPNATLLEHLSSAVWSYGLDGNIFTLALPSVYDPAALYVLDPNRVTCKASGRWELRTNSGTEALGADQLIHITRARKPGTLRGLSPIDEASATLTPYRQAIAFGSRVFTNGVYMSGYIQLPQKADKPTRDEIREEVLEQYGGRNQHKPGVFGGGAEWKVPQLSLEALQFLDLQKFGKAEIANLYGVPAYLVGITEPGAMAYSSVEQQSTDFERYTIRAIVERLETGYRRLIPGAYAFERYLTLDTNGLLRGDFKTRTEGYANLLDRKVLRPAEVRAAEGYAPDPDMPGYLETPNNNAPSTSPEARGVRAPILTAMTGGRP